MIGDMKLIFKEKVTNFLLINFVETRKKDFSQHNIESSLAFFPSKSRDSIIIQNLGLFV